MNVSVSNHNWVCFECRTTVRKPKSDANAPTLPACSRCGASLVNIGYKIDVPRKSDVKAWKALREWCRHARLGGIEDEIRSLVQKVHRLEKVILEEEEKPFNADRKRAIEQRRVEMSNLRTRILNIGSD